MSCVNEKDEGKKFQAKLYAYFPRLLTPLLRHIIARIKRALA